MEVQGARQEDLVLTMSLKAGHSRGVASPRRLSALAEARRVAPRWLLITRLWFSSEPGT